MKKTLLLIPLLFIVAYFAVAQQVPRNLVVLEIGTGTWCQFCPAASNGADDLLENGYSVAVIKYHSGDEFTNAYSSSRVSYYNISGFPTAFFDGLNPVVGGGNASQSMFPQYSAKVNQRMAIPSSFTIAMEGTHSCLTDFTANITVNKVATNNSSNLRLHAVLTEKHIPKSWQGMSEVNHACRLMIPNQFGTSVSFGSGNTQQYSLQFSLDPSWFFENLELVVFLQDQSTREIFQGVKAMLSDFLPEKSFDVGVNKIDNLPEASCNGVVEPRVRIRNYGSETINSLDIVYHVNNGTPITYPWTGSLNYLDSDLITLPPIDFEVAEENELFVYTMNPNGFGDECPNNDEMTSVIPGAMQTPLTVRLFLRTDANPHETTWELKNSSDEVLFSGGPYSVSGQTIQQIFDLEDDDCYTFTIYDSGGDGLQSPGIVMLFYGNNNIIYQGRGFGESATVEFQAGDLTGISGTPFENLLSIYPNPVTDYGFISLNLASDANIEVFITNLAGQKVMQVTNKDYSAGSHKFALPASELDAGVYIVSVRSNEILLNRKIVVLR